MSVLMRSRAAMTAHGLLIVVALGATAVQAAAQHMIAPPAAIEQRMRMGEFRIISWNGSRKPTDRTQRVGMEFTDSITMVAKWALAPRNGGDTFNNEPRYEVAAYELQKLFLAEDEYVVPPTVLRAFPITFVAAQMPNTNPTFNEAKASVLIVLQYWLSSVTPTDFWIKERARTDTAYARAIGNFNILTYLIRHGDENVGNYLISANTASTRIFSVDNGVSFNSELSNRGFAWIDIRVEQLPRAAIDRLRTVTRDTLEKKLGIIAEYRVQDGALVPAEPAHNLNKGRGIRRTPERIQLGLTTLELNRIDQRLRDLLKKVDEGKIKVF